MATKLTPSEKAQKKADQKAKILAENAEYERQRQEDLAVYKASIPKRLMEAQALASWLGIYTEVSLTATGPAVTFREENTTDNRPYICEIITYETEEWELDALEDTLKDMKAKRDAYDARRVVAGEVWSRLSDNEKIALKEHIHWMR